MQGKWGLASSLAAAGLLATVIFSLNTFERGGRNGGKKLKLPSVPGNGDSFAAPDPQPQPQPHPRRRGQSYANDLESAKESIRRASGGSGGSRLIDGYFAVRCSVANRLRTRAEEEQCNQRGIKGVVNITSTYDSIMARGRGRYFIDLGANAGQDSSMAAKQGMKVVAFEPYTRNHMCFNREMKLKNLTQGVTLVKAAVSDKPGRTFFYIPDTQKLWRQNCPETGGVVNQSFWTKNLAIASKRDYADITTLDLALPKHLPVGTRPLLLHADVQGHELSAFKGAKEEWAKRPPIWLHFEFWPAGMRNNGYEPIELLEFLHSKGFACMSHPDSVWHQNATGHFFGVTDFDGLVGALGFKPFPHHFTDVLCRHIDRQFVEAIQSSPVL